MFLLVPIFICIKEIRDNFQIIHTILTQNQNSTNSSLRISIMFVYRTIASCNEQSLESGYNRTNDFEFIGFLLTVRASKEITPGFSLATTLRATSIFFTLWKVNLTTNYYWSLLFCALQHFLRNLWGNSKGYFFDNFFILFHNLKDQINFDIF